MVEVGVGMGRKKSVDQEVMGRRVGEWVGKLSVSKRTLHRRVSVRPIWRSK
jgi:hypothetical protein